jgi:POT family proton-dependent oligopeptide transporter
LATVAPTVSSPPPEARPPADTDTRFFGHPRGLSTLFFTEFWERFSYYGMRAILILFMTAPVAVGGLAFDTAKAGVIYGTYTALAWLAALPGGWVADRFLGQRRATLYGGVVIMLGHIALAVPTIPSFYLGLACVVIGTGLLKANVSAMVGQLYGADDTRRDAGFSIFYMGINLGASISPFICGWLAQSPQFAGMLRAAGIRPETAWHWGFGAAAVGMFFGVIQYLGGWKHLGAAGMNPIVPDDPAEHARNRRRLQLGIVATIAVILGVTALARTGALQVTPRGVGNGFGIGLLVGTVLLWWRLLANRSWTPSERKRLLTMLVLFIASTVFWSLYEQQGSTLNLFADRSTDNRLFGMAFPASWFQAVAPIFLIVLAPVFAWIWMRLGKRDPSSPTKFAFGLAFVGLGFVVLVPAAALSASGVKVSPLWLTLTYLLHTIGELCLSPVGLSATTKLAPARVAGLMMGVWFLTISLGSYLGGRVASVYEAYSLTTLFGLVGGAAIVAAVVLAVAVRPINRMLKA